MKKLLIGIVLLVGLVLAFSDWGTPEFTGSLDTMVDKYRTEQGLTPLNEDEQLATIAEAKCNEMVERQYFSHENPEGKYIWEMIDLDYTVAGENLAGGYTTAYDTVSGWVQSETHRDNLLNANYTEVGYGVCWDKNNNDYKVVQLLKG